MTAFADALGVLFSDPNISLAATWKVGGVGAGVSVRIVLKQPDQTINFGVSHVVVPTSVVDVRKSDVAQPKRGDTVVVIATGATYEITAPPMLDTLHLVWTCDAVERD